MLKSTLNGTIGNIVQVGIIALTLVASTQAFARGEGGGGGGGGGEGGAGEIAAVSTAPKPETPPPQISRGRRTVPTVFLFNCEFLKDKRQCF